MPATLSVPAAVRETARKALDLHSKRPLSGVGGIVVAKSLAEGPATLDTVRRMRRFFTINERAFREGTQLQHTVSDYPLMRSWALHGGQSGRVWSEGVCRAAEKNGDVEEDSWVYLLRTTPDELYERLSFGAWQWEYGMDTRQAARFVEEYQRANGTDFRYDRAFGESANAVKAALIRRIEGENPFKQLARTVMREQYRTASQLDLQENKRSLGRAALGWPEFIGYFVLATHAPELAEEIVPGHGEHPWRGRDPKPILEYPDVMSAFVTFFHPKGVLYRKDAPQRLMADMDRLLWEAMEGELTEQFARSTLVAARCWTGRAGRARGLGHTLLEAWARREWDLFLEALPLDSSVRPRFEVFAGKVEGSWLAPTGVVDGASATP
jgi:hypothetical protein